MANGRRCRVYSDTFREGGPLIELFLHCFHFGHRRFTHEQNSERLEVRNDGTPAFIAGIALYFKFFDGGTYVDGNAKCLDFSPFAYGLEHEAEATNRGRERFEGGSRSKSAIDWCGNGDRHLD